MKEICISDVTMCGKSASLSFKEKIELAKLLDRLGVSVIELPPVEKPKIDCLLIKSIAASVRESAIAVPVSLDGSDISVVWNALKEAKRPRLRVIAPVSTVQMEYLTHMKKEEMLTAVKTTVAACRALCPDVEFVAGDATRSEGDLLYAVLAAAIGAGANVVTIADAAGEMLPDEFSAFLRGVKEHVPEIESVTLAVSCSNELALANSCAIAALLSGAGELKTHSHGAEGIVLEDLSRMISARGQTYGVYCRVRITNMKRILRQISWLCETSRSKTSPFDNGVQHIEGLALSPHDDITAVAAAAEKLGYDLSDEDKTKVYEAFKRNAERKGRVELKELDAIIAAAAMQVPPAYRLESYVVNTCNIMAATAHVRLTRQDGERIEGVSLGDGPIDAAFLAVEQIIGCHYELDDFQIQAVTEGREALGQTVVRLRAGGRLYSGRGISTDIIGASILAYINALNKIVYEEEGV